MRRFYSFLMHFFTPYLLLRLWFKGRRLPAYRQRISERFCWDSAVYHSVDVWLHAVSLGEVIAATPLIEAMLENGWSVLVTTMTPTGSEQVSKCFANRVAHRYVPYDISSVVRRFFKMTQPRIGVIVETELWPNLIYEASAANIPLFLANARLSERSLTGYMRFKFLFAPLLRQFSAILAQSNDDARRFIALGAQEAQVKALGNMKFDIHTHNIDSTTYALLKERWGGGRRVVIAASTHEDEELQILACFNRLQQAIPGVILLIAPRHPERFESIYQLSQQQGFNTGLRSLAQTLHGQNEVVVLDCLGELLGWYQMSDYAFVGGSLVPVGGHNVLEPIAMGVPVLSGRHVHNFKTICADLERAQAIVLVDDAVALVDALIELECHEDLKKSMVNNATKVLNSNKGSVQKHLACIQRSWV